MRTLLLAANAAGIAQAGAILREGGLVSFGTETVYGLGADATDNCAVAAIFAAKNRPQFNPLICHYPATEAAWNDVAPNELALGLAAQFWPGPLTLVLPRRAGSLVSLLAGAGLDTLAVRVPAHPVATALLRAAGCPVAAPSANRSGQISPTCAAHVLAGLDGRIDAVLDGGPCAVGLESTILDLSGQVPMLLRAGGVTMEAIEAAIGMVSRAAADETLRAPGMMRSHYAPALPLRIAANSVAPDEALLAFGPPLPGGAITVNLSPSGDLMEAAAHLFAALRELDEAGLRAGLRGIAAMEVPETGIGLAINDRLSRAAAPR